MEHYVVNCVEDLVPIEDSLRFGLACVAVTNDAFLPPRELGEACLVSVSVLTPGQPRQDSGTGVVEALRALVLAWGAEMAEMGCMSGQFVILPAEDDGEGSVNNSRQPS